MLRGNLTRNVGANSGPVDGTAISKSGFGIAFNKGRCLVPVIGKLRYTVGIPRNMASSL